MGAIDLATASWRDAGEAITCGAWAVLPVGALEQHGYHLPLTVDTDLASGVARGIADALGALLLPAIAYGDAWNNSGFLGTISLKPETLKAIVLDIGRELRRMGVPVMVTLNGHFGNREPIALAARILQGEGLKVVHLDYPGLEALAAEICDSPPAGPGFFHADEVETSMMLALRPDSVRMEKAVAEYPVFPATFGIEPMQLSAFNQSGVFGDPCPSTADKGRRLIGGIVAACLAQIESYRSQHRL
ncbi:creatininase family protein [Pleomorphomonas sp. NRK KF1]|uniref:creatininase family protein n=1 Tax=Pleomorphomonas sp. NRK KF1 TaxID=2943000 RepID=UPI002044B005|nr:creatininase family protein [Pleomorphomonas sp. NRK KF1]MCM5552949.1 creatininase family protein [Pleomorphomonas sp. NRK KF1]